MLTPSRVLYVKHSNVGDSIEQSIDQEKITAVQSESGVDALKRLDNEWFDIVIVPDTLPDVELTWFCNRVRSLPIDASVIVYGEPAEVPDEVMVVESDDSGNNLRQKLDELIADRNIDSALNHYNQLKDVAFDIARYSATAQSADKVLEACYDRLLGSSLYEFVWVGHYDSEKDQFEVERPFPGQFSPKSVSEALGVSSSNFVKQAVETVEISIASGTEITRSATAHSPDVRSESRSSLSFAAVPFAYEDQVHGLVLLGASRMDAFDHTERSILSDLGRIIGWYAHRHLTPNTTDRSRLTNINQFVDIFAHELRNPLTIAESYLEIVKGDRDDEALRRIADAHQEIEDIIDAVVSMADPGGIERTEEVEITARAATIWKSIPGESAELVLGEPLTFEADQGLLDRLLTNLFNNAIEHGGPNVTVRIGALDDHRGFFIEDNGVGIPEDVRETVFEWGYSTSEHNLGIGLAFVREIADAHGWEIRVAEALSGGARFEVII